MGGGVLYRHLWAINRSLWIRILFRIYGMIVFPGMLVKAAKKAGMKVPEDPDNDTTWSAEDFPHFHVFCNVQLARPVSFHGEHWHNAEVVAAVKEEELKSLTLEDLIARGLHYRS
jgi:hypothetical protein